MTELYAYSHPFNFETVYADHRVVRDPGFRRTDNFSASWRRYRNLPSSQRFFISASILLIARRHAGVFKFLSQSVKVIGIHVFGLRADWMRATA
jgi:hypothetical protein